MMPYVTRLRCMMLHGEYDDDDRRPHNDQFSDDGHYDDQGLGRRCPPTSLRTSSPSARVGLIRATGLRSLRWVTIGTVPLAPMHCHAVLKQNDKCGYHR